jgi:peptidyl-prolyl cis-trans isomerase C
MKFKHIRWWWLFLIVLLSAGAAYAQQKTADESAAVTVNGVVISREQLQNEVQRQLTQLSQQNQMPLDDAVRARVEELVLDRMITDELMYQDSLAQGFAVTEEERDAEMQKIKQKFTQADDFQATLDALHMSEAELADKLQRALAIQRLVDHLMEAIEVTDEEMRQFYAQHPEPFQTPEQIQARHILIKVATDASEADKTQARDKIAALQKRLTDGEDFAALARDHSEGPSNVRGGDLGYFMRGQMVAPFENAAFALAVGETSDIVETPFGYHLIQVTDRRPATVIAFEDARAELQQQVRNAKSREIIGRYIEDLRSKADIQPAP